MEKSGVPFSDLMLNISKEIQIKAPVETVFESLIEQMGPGMTHPDGSPMDLKFEPWPGGRWFRDLGNNTGHFWGHVQVIKPPTLLEITGPMFMSYPILNHVQYRLTTDGSGTKLTLLHRCLGEVSPEHRIGMTKGWDHILTRLKLRSEG